MKALAYHGPHDVRVDSVPDPVLHEPDDILVRVTATAICGTDLHLYRGKVPEVLPGDVLGHEFMGVVEEVGKGVRRLRRGDRVVVPATIACGECFFCERSLFAACERTNPSRGLLLQPKGIRSAAGIFGCSHLYGGYAGGQAELVRVPRADIGPLKVPEELPDERVLFLSDILPTAYQAVVSAGIGNGSTVAIYGAGPVGLLAAACARMLGAERIFMVDRVDNRLDFAARTYGAETIHFARQHDPARYILDHTDHRGVDATIDAVGFEAEGCFWETLATNLGFQHSSGCALKQTIAATRRGGVLSVPGMYAGYMHFFPFGDLFEKGITLRTGTTHVQAHMMALLPHLATGDLVPEVIVSHRLPLEQASRGYQLFDAKQDGCRKVVLFPGTSLVH
jgi:threonine dehydrogenase-like Zn-dependent dehydrogenase